MNQYDDIRKNFRAYRVPVDKDRLWANTSHAIPKKTRRRGAFYLLFAGALLIGTGSLYYALFKTGNSPTTHHAHVPPSIRPPVSLTNEPGIIHTHAAPIHGETIQPNSAGHMDQVPNEQNVQGISDHHPIPQEKTMTSAIPDAALTPSDPAGQSTGATYVRAASEQLVDQASPFEITANMSTDQIESTPDHDERGQNPGELSGSTRGENFSTEEVSVLPVAEMKVSPRDHAALIPVASRVKNKNRFTLRIMQGYGWSAVNMYTNASEWYPTLDTWKGKVKSLENLATSLHTGIRLPNGIQLGTGFQYSKLTTALEYQQTLSENFNEQGITAIIIGENGELQNLYGDVSVNRQTIVRSTRFTSHVRFDIECILSIPVSRGYRTETGVWVKTGYNLLYESQGTTFSPGGEPVKFYDAENPYTLQSPFTFGAGLSTMYRINPHWSLQAKAGYERLRYTHGLYEDRIAFHHSIFSLSLGTGYVF